MRREMAATAVSVQYAVMAVSITKSGAAVADQIIQQIAEQSARMYNAIPAKDLEQFSNVVSLISAQLESEVVTS